MYSSSLGYETEIGNSYYNSQSQETRPYALVYKGPGVNEACHDNTVEALSRLINNSVVKGYDSSYVESGQVPNGSVLFIPGGHALDLDSGLGERGFSAIKNGLDNGVYGGYFGTCAGAIAACAYYNINGQSYPSTGYFPELEVAAELLPATTPLKLERMGYTGDGYSANEFHGLRAASPSFEIMPENETTQVVAKYLDAESERYKAAVVVDSGRYVLAGHHWEIPQDFSYGGFPDSKGKDLIYSSQAEQDRLTCYLCQYLGLDPKNPQ
ncbi:MAG: hypothetical protein CMO81_07940 [Waddliaceae bacterium]|nr:hypothetical protein [Waddliaceae bacterium]